MHNTEHRILFGYKEKSSTGDYITLSANITRGSKVKFRDTSSNPVYFDPDKSYKLVVISENYFNATKNSVTTQLVVDRAIKYYELGASQCVMDLWESGEKGIGFGMTSTHEGAIDIGGKYSDLYIKNTPVLSKLNTLTAQLSFTQLWSGSWTTGSITVPGWSDWELIVVRIGYHDALCPIMYTSDGKGRAEPCVAILDTNYNTIFSAIIASVGNVLSFATGYTPGALSHAVGGAHIACPAQPIQGIWGVKKR